MTFVREHIRSLLLAMVIVVYLKFLLEPTAWMFYELHHLSGIDAVYWGYSLFRGAGYYFGEWEYQNLTIAGVALAIIAIAWWRGINASHKDIESSGE